MTTDYTPGTVAVATVRGVDGVRVMRAPMGVNYEWVSAAAIGPVAGTSLHESRHVRDVRPLVVLDLSNYGNDPTLAVQTLRNAGHSALGIRQLIADQIAAQTKSSLNEPTGKYAEVQNGEGMTYYRDPRGIWHRASDNLERPWNHIDAVRVLSEGVSA